MVLTFNWGLGWTNKHILYTYIVYKPINSLIQPSSHCSLLCVQAKQERQKTVQESDRIATKGERGEGKEQRD